MKIDWSWTGAIGALLDRAMGKMLKPPALTRAQKGLPFHKWPGYPGPKAPGKTDRRHAARALRKSLAPQPKCMTAPERVHRRHGVVFGSPPLVGQNPRRVWRDGEPVHVVKPVRAARIAAARKATEILTTQLKEAT